MIEEIKNTFVNNSIEELKAIEEFLSQNIDHIASDCVIEKVFTTTHNIKGTAPMLGITNVDYIVKPLELVYSHLRNGKIAISKDIINNTQKLIPVIMTELTESDKNIVDSKDVKESIRFFDSLISENA